MKKITDNSLSKFEDKDIDIVVFSHEHITEAGNIFERRTYLDNMNLKNIQALEKLSTL